MTRWAIVRLMPHQADDYYDKTGLWGAGGCHQFTCRDEAERMADDLRGAYRERIYIVIEINEG